MFAENPDFGTFNMPWFFPLVEDYRQLLEHGGFYINRIELISRPTPLTSGVEKWLEIFADGITSHMKPTQKLIFYEAVKDKLLPVLYTEKEGWVADYVRLRFAATKP